MRLIENPKFQAFDNDGVPLVGGKLYTYTEGTSTPLSTYSNVDCTVPNTNPVILDSRGEATLFLSGSYKFVLKDSADSSIWSLDNIRSSDYANIIYAGTDLPGAVAIAGSSQKTILVDQTCTLIADLTVPGNVQLVVLLGGRLHANDGVTVTLERSPEAGAYTIFSWNGTGKFKLGTASKRQAVVKADVCWWGAVDCSYLPSPSGLSDGLWIDSSEAFQKALDSAPTKDGTWPDFPGHYGHRVEVPLGCYLVADVNPGNVEAMQGGIYGRGSQGTTKIRRKVSATYGAFYLNTAQGGDGYNIENIYFQCPSDGVKAGLAISSWPTLKLRNCWFSSGVGIYCDGIQDLDLSHSTFEFCVSGLLTSSTGVFDLKVTKCNFADCNRAIYGDGFYSAVISDNIFHHGVSYASSLTAYIEIAQAAGVAKDIDIHGNIFQGRNTTKAVGDHIKLTGTGTQVKIDDNRFIGNVGRCVNSGANWTHVQVTNNQVRYTDAPLAIADRVFSTGGAHCNVDNNRIFIELVNSLSTGIIAANIGGLYSTANGNKIHLTYNNAGALAATNALILLGADGGQALGNILIIEQLGAGALTVAKGINTGTNIDGCRVQNNNYHTVGGAVFTYRYYFNTAAAGLCNYSSMGENPAFSADNGDANATFYPYISAKVQRFATVLTAARTITLPTSSAFHGTEFLVVRTGGGGFNLDVGGLRTLNAANQWCLVAFDPQTAAYTLVSYGTL